MVAPVCIFTHLPTFMRFIIVFVCVFLSLHGFPQTGNNTVSGFITFSEKSAFILKKGTSYEHRNSAHSPEKVRLDALNDPKRNVYVSLHPVGFTAQLPVVNAQVTQREKTFFPNVVAITAGSTVYFMNEDEHFHNIYSVTPKSRFNIGRRPPGNVYGQRISKVGIIRLGCDIHLEMAAIILSMDTPYFSKVNPDGSFAVSGLPDGEYEIRAYHPSYHLFSDTVVCRGGNRTTHNITLTSK